MAELAHNLRVRFCEVDEYGFVWHGHYLAWIEAARIELMREADLTPARLLELGYLVPVVDIRVNCKRPVRADSRVTVSCSIEPTEKALLTFQFRIADSDTGEIHATASTSHVLMDRGEKLLYILPEEIRAPLEQLIAKYPAPGSTCESP